MPSLNLSQALNSGGLTFSGAVPWGNYTPAPTNYTPVQANDQAAAARSRGSVLGISTGPAPTATARPSAPAATTAAPQQPSQPSAPSDPYAEIKAGISSAWDNYINSLGDTQNTLSSSRDAQNNIAETQYNSGVDAVNSQKASSLRDIADTTRNAFQAGNNYLGSMGAGDSSAANQYSFAINQQTNKQIGKLNEFVNTQLTNLKSTHDQQVNQIAQWFSEQQNALKQMIAQGQLSKGQDLNNLSRSILDQAISATNQLKANTQNQYNALVEWATNNSQNISQLRSNIAAIPSAMGGITTATGGNAPVYGGATTNQKYDLFGNPIG